ncbi:hypothetical protein [uncultured Corynebacterium sp.]|uniref:hypothetical protein n=1 Tax=uncultured Corynebacterium sp. TaxID=159447 RepID=UPI0025D77F9E|nr:hypothetical protein [uncultured Corynebacterium sp.]
MTLKSVVRRGALATVATASAVALVACSAGQVSQTANQVAAVDGAQNEMLSSPEGIALRDVHIVVDPDGGQAALKFNAINQERSLDSEYTLTSVDVEGVGPVDLSPVTSTESHERAAEGELEIPRECQIVADYAGAIEDYSENAADNPSCITYVTTSLDSSTLVGQNSSAIGENRNVTFVFDGPEGTEEIEMFVTISSYITEAGEVDRGDDGLVEGAEPRQASDADDDATGEGANSTTTPAAEQQVGQINQQ